MNGFAVFVTDALNQAQSSRDIETTCCPHRHPADMGADLLSFRDHRLHNVASLKAKGKRRFRNVATREAVLVRPTFLPRTVTSRLDVERLGCADF